MWNILPDGWHPGPLEDRHKMYREKEMVEEEIRLEIISAGRKMTGRRGNKESQTERKISSKSYPFLSLSCCEGLPSWRCTASHWSLTQPDLGFHCHWQMTNLKLKEVCWFVSDGAKIHSLRPYFLPRFVSVDSANGVKTRFCEAGLMPPV